MKEANTRASFLFFQLRSPNKAAGSWRKGNRRYLDVVTDTQIAASDSVQESVGHTKYRVPREDRARELRDKILAAIFFDPSRGPRSSDSALLQGKNNDSRRLDENNPETRIM